MRETLAIIKRIFSEEWKTLMLLSAAAVLFSLPIVTIGPALLAMNGSLTRIVDDRHTLRWFNDFWSIFKAKFLRGLLLELVAGLYILAMMYATALADALGSGGDIVRIFLVVSLVLAALVSVYLVPLLGDTTIPFFQALWASVSLAFARLPRSILAAGAVYGMIYLFLLFYPVTVVLYAMLLLASTAAVSVSLTWPVVNELLFPDED